jgi:UDP-N-acetylglucosamine--N-acetylmuramyl-(pentapeptide) pyrophosphoryl-undecaprenol N-acetylglucosamine transferase
LGRLYFAVFGSGLGHATRMLDIAGSFRGNGDSIRFSCSDQGLRYIRTQMPGADTVQSPEFDVEWTEQGSFSSRDFVVHFPLMLRSFGAQVAFEAENIPKYHPRVVVSDSRLSPVLAAKAKSYPVITMLNQFKVTLPPRYRGGVTGRLWERIAGDVLGLMWSVSDQVLLTDLPPPYTIGEANVAGTDLTRVVRYVGFTSPSLEIGEERLQKARSVLDHDTRPLVFFQISGPDATKKRLADVLLRSAAQLSRTYKVVVSMGYLGGSSEPKRFSEGALIYDWCPIKDELFMLSRVMVARSGHRTIVQCIDSRKPAVLVPIENHSEQLGNAEKFEKLGLGISIMPGGLRPENISASVDDCIRDTKYETNLERVAQISSRYRGIDMCTDIIRSYA